MDESCVCVPAPQTPLRGINLRTTQTGVPGGHLPKQSMDAYEPLEVIGSGSFGVIRKVRRKSDGRVLVRKEIEYGKMSEKEKRQLVSEVNILRELRHPNIVRYYERFVDRADAKIYIIMEWCEGGDLAGIIKQCKKENKRIPEDVVWNLLTQLLLALHECHHGNSSGSSAGSSIGSSGSSDAGSKSHPTILHRDIKPDNVFLDGAQNVKLGDFGLSRIISNPEIDFAKTFVGTPFYMSPELVSETSYNTKSDIWALGCLIYELCALEPPFQSKTQAGLTQKIRMGKIEPLPPQYSGELTATIKAMLNINHMKRPSTSEFLKLHRVRLCIKERGMMADFKKREDELRRREAALEAREAALSVREEEVRRLLHDVETGKEGGGSSARRLSEELAAAIGGNSSLVGSTLEGGLAEGSTLRDEELVRIGSVDDLTRHVSFMQQLSRQESGVAPPRATITQQSRFAPTVQPFVRNPSALPIATHAAAISAAPTSPSPFRRGIQLRAPQQPHVYANSGLNPSSNENRPQASGAPLDKNLQRVASVGGFRAAGGVMTPTKKGTNVYELPSSPASPMQLSSP